MLNILVNKTKIFCENLLLKTSVPSGDKEIEEISSMAGGSVEGYAMPLGAKKKKKKKVYMEPHMHQDE